MHSIWQAIVDTPYWVYALFAYLMWIGYLARKPRRVPLKPLAIIPAFFLFFSISALYYYGHITPTLKTDWGISLLIGLLLGWAQYRFLYKIRYDRQARKIFIPGSWNLLIIFILLFAFRYYYAYNITLHPGIIYQPSFLSGLIIVYGLFTGLFLGRFLYCLYCVKFGPFTDNHA